MMALKSAPYYWVECDDCGASSAFMYEELSEDEEAVVESVEDSDWLITDDGHWCPGCREEHESEGDDE